MAPFRKARSVCTYAAALPLPRPVYTSAVWQRRHLPPDAVRGREDVIAVEQGAAAVELAVVDQAHHPGVAVHARRPAAHDPDLLVDNSAVCQDDNRDVIHHAFKSLLLILAIGHWP